MKSGARRAVDPHAQNFSVRADLEDKFIALGRQCSRMSDDERELRALELRNTHPPLDATTLEIAEKLLSWEPEPLAGGR